MRKKMLGLFFCFTLLTACSEKENSLVDKTIQLEEDKAKLTQRISDQQNEINNLNQSIAEEMI